MTYCDNDNTAGDSNNSTGDFEGFTWESNDSSHDSYDNNGDSINQLYLSKDDSNNLSSKPNGDSYDIC